MKELWVPRVPYSDPVYPTGQGFPAWGPSTEPHGNRKIIKNSGAIRLLGQTLTALEFATPPVATW
ncbi:hypothetical protein Sinac_0558 [Singulisphaera acidiphila DSM 18658]|uniref:Uncharacterized protein n=1 Tax=Singulisphaera acidiphila (strain ATCC BAA-1392 / DSM 18658 / VKM B-2454 / MOB10) TaxID=886293 RepID=L0D6X1_SINAD|nr:hypothetical protein Sinac_0558 [Singulisphaera acidiphila DSM 18658]